MAKTRAHVFVSGRVQGVNFRAYARREALARGVAGWVRNNPDGRVEAVLEGEAPDVQGVIDWCRRGPSLARVDRVEVEWGPYTGEFDGFDVLHEAYW